MAGFEPAPQGPAFSAATNYAMLCSNNFFLFSDRLPNLCHRCDTEGQNNLVYAQIIPIDLGADPLSQDRIVGVFGIF